MKKKNIKVKVGTDIAVTIPSHPLSVVLQIKKIIDRIMLLPDNEFEYSCNSVEGIMMFYHYGQLKNVENIIVSFYINGSKSTYEDAMKDLMRGKEFVKQFIENEDESIGHI